MNETKFKLEVRPRIPARLRDIEELANDLLYSWDRSVRGLFYRLDPLLWEACNHNPKVFLHRVSQQILDDAAEDRFFLEDFHTVMAAYRNYHTQSMHPYIEDFFEPQEDLIAYFCAEFGFHESFPIYSGGLGILAGDHCKAASDLGMPFVAIGLLYRQGYFIQTIDASGNQMASYCPSNIDELLISPARDAEGNELTVEVPLADRQIKVKVWRAKAGHIELYLLDSDLPDNTPEERSITFQLYGGDRHTRIQQEMILGIGGVRALRALGKQPKTWHINEGHAAFQVLERCREFVADGMDFFAALELTAAGTVFTTHTPVPAGHDIFVPELMNHYFSDYVEELGLGMDELLALGHAPNGHAGFNMTSMALRGSRFHNGVSRIHGGVASKMESYIWPDIAPAENPIHYVTNGVHVPTFLAREWVNLFDMRFSAWRSELLNPDYWSCIDSIPDHRFWSLRQELKATLLEDVEKRVIKRMERAGLIEADIKRKTRHISTPDANVLVLGFARRFATYKRATLLFSDPQRLARMLNDPERPVVIIFAGKAHPSDLPGQQLIRTIHEFSMRPEFIGKIILLEGYDMALARKMVTGVDVWLNNPEYPLEASGTSGQKAAINGVINLSVLDGWWGEGYNGENGWAIHPHSDGLDRDAAYHEEANELYHILENEVIPRFYTIDARGYSSAWVQMSKASMKSCIPRFNSQRMVVDYLTHFYAPARNHCLRLGADNAAPAAELAQWKHRIRQQWGGVTCHLVERVSEQVDVGDTVTIRVGVNLNSLTPEDVILECLIGNEDNNGEFVVTEKRHFVYNEQKGREHCFSLELKTAQSGLNFYKIRLYPYHPLLAHPFEVGHMLWL